MKHAAVLLIAFWILWSRTYTVPGNNKTSSRPPDHAHIPVTWVPIEEFRTEQSCLDATKSTVAKNLATLAPITGVERSTSEGHPHLLFIRFREHITVVHYQCFPNSVYPKDPD